MSNGWSKARRARQSQLIQAWKPWKKSSGPKTEEGKKIASRNAYKEGGKSKLLREQLRDLKQLLKEQDDYLNTL